MKTTYINYGLNTENVILSPYDKRFIDWYMKHTEVMQETGRMFLFNDKLSKIIIKIDLQEGENYEQEELI